MSKIIGILGGMGPLATVAFEEVLLKSSGATCDQEYPILITINDGTLPDRTKAIFEQGESPVPKMKMAIERLKSLGASVICMPCNTAHLLVNALSDTFESITFVHIVEAVRDRILEQFPDTTTIGLLATTASQSGKLYDQLLNESDIQIVYPDNTHQKLVTDCIFSPEGIKAGYITESKLKLEQCVEHLKTKGAQVIVLGCTELPLALKHASLPLIDSNEALALAVLRAANA